VCQVRRAEVNSIYIELYSLCGEELLNDQRSCAGGTGSQSVSLGGWVAQIRKDPGVAEKV